MDVEGKDPNRKRNDLNTSFDEPRKNQTVPYV